MKLTRVLIIGGTHGNEWTGARVVTQYQQRFIQKYPTLQLEFILGNPKAFEQNRRFTEEDLNRAFQFLNEKSETFEHKRAREIKARIDESPCFVIDLHTTTSNLGKTIILSHYEKINCFVASALTEKISDCRVIGSPDPQKKYLASQSPFGMMIEVGPIPNGILEAKALEGTLEILDGILSSLSTLPEHLNGAMEYYEEAQDQHYPKNEKGELSAYIHSEFQGKDFTKIFGDYTPFRSFSGTDIQLKTSEELYPIFINEAAYYPQQLAFTLCRKRILQF